MLIMRVKQLVKKAIKSVTYPIVKGILDEEFDKRLIIAEQMRDYSNAPDDMLASKVESQTDIADLVARLKEQGVPIIEETIDIADYEKWGRVFPDIVNMYSGDVKIEKSLEHYLTFKHLDTQNNDVFMDVAAGGSNWGTILRKSYGIKKAYRQDLVYKDGINGFDIGGNAGDMPLPDEYVDVMTLHCAYECFQGNSDIEFIREAGRVLKQRGRLGIVPLYMDSVYFVKSGPKADRRHIDVEKEARWIWRDDDYLSEPFSRHYSPESFKERVMRNIVGGMEGEVIHFTNLGELEEHFLGQRIYCHFMFRAVKV